jgi:hypothetical protein
VTLGANAALLDEVRSYHTRVHSCTWHDQICMYVLNHIFIPCVYTLLYTHRHPPTHMVHPKLPKIILRLWWHHFKFLIVGIIYPMVFTPPEV